MNQSQLIEWRRERNYDYWMNHIIKNYSGIFKDKDQLKNHIDTTYKLVEDLMLGYQEMGNEWWLKHDAKMAYYQTQTPELFVSIRDFLNQAGVLLGRHVSTEEYTDLSKRSKLYAQIQKIYTEKYKATEKNEILCEKNI